MTDLEDILSAHETLGLQPYAGDGDLQASYRRLALRTHPDAGGTAEDFRRVQEAYELLKDPYTRIVYRRRLDEEAERQARAARRSQQSRADDPTPPPPRGRAEGKRESTSGTSSNGESRSEHVRYSKERRKAEQAKVATARQNRRFLWAALGVFFLGNTVLSPFKSSFGVFGPTITPFLVFGVALALGVTWLRFPRESGHPTCRLDEAAGRMSPWQSQEGSSPSSTRPRRPIE